MVCRVGGSLRSTPVPQDVIQPGLREKLFDSEGTEPLIVRAEHSDREFGCRKTFLLREVCAACVMVQAKAEINGFAVALHSPSVLTKCPGPFPERFGGPQIPIFVGNEVACLLEGVNEIRAHPFLTKPSDHFFACDILPEIADRLGFGSGE